MLYMLYVLRMLYMLYVIYMSYVICYMLGPVKFKSPLTTFKYENNITPGEFSIEIKTTGTNFDKLNKFCSISKLQI